MANREIVEVMMKKTGDTYSISYKGISVSSFASKQEAIDHIEQTENVAVGSIRWR